jgi:hypothetical protein
MEYCNVVVIKEGVVDECALILGTSREEVGKRAEEVFAEKCAAWGWADLTEEEQTSALDDGYWAIANGSVCITWPDAVPLDLEAPGNGVAYVVSYPVSPTQMVVKVTRNKDKAATYKNDLSQRFNVCLQEVIDLDDELTGVAEVDTLTPIRARAILANIFNFMFMEEDGTLNPDKEIPGTDTVSFLCEEMPGPNQR